MHNYCARQLGTISYYFSRQFYQCHILLAALRSEECSGLSLMVGLIEAQLIGNLGHLASVLRLLKALWSRPACQTPWAHSSSGNVVLSCFLVMFAHLQHSHTIDFTESVNFYDWNLLI